MQGIIGVVCYTNLVSKFYKCKLLPVVSLDIYFLYGEHVAKQLELVMLLDPYFVFLQLYNVVNGNRWIKRLICFTLFVDPVYDVHAL